MSDADKKVEFVGTSKNDLSAFPKSAKAVAGFQLHQLEKGLDPTRWKPMATVGAGVSEIIINQDDAYRVFYVAKFANAIYVLHAFQKTTQKTSKKDIEIGRQRYEIVTKAQELIKAKKKADGK